MRSQKNWLWFFGVVVCIVLVSPLIYWSTGIGQAATSLSAELGRLPGGLLVSSPKAQAWRSLNLPMRIERLFIYPLLMLAFQLSGGATFFRKWLETALQSGAARRLSRFGQPFGWLGQRLPNSWRGRLSGFDLLLIFLFVVLLHLGLFLLYLPFNFYRGFILAHQFDLSTQNAAGWLSDWGKNVVISLILDGLLWGGLYSLMRLLPQRWPVVSGALLMASSFGLTVLAPIVITPLFYQVQPLDNPELESRILTLAERAGMPVDDVYVIDASTKTTQVNAYVASFGEAQRIVLYDTLLAGYTPDQVEVVLAHELGHWHYHHVFLGVLGMGALGWIGLFGLRWILNRVYRRLSLQSPGDVAGLPFVLAVIALVTMLSLPVQNTISRYAENQADEFSLRVSQKPDTFVTSFEQLAEQNLSIVNPPAWEKFIFYTHPPISERIQRVERFQHPKPNLFRKVSHRQREGWRGQ